MARAGTIRELTGPRRQVFDVRFKGDAAAVLTDLKDLGGDWRESEDGVRLFLPDGSGPETIFRLAKECGAQVRYLRPGAETLEDVFLAALGHEIQADADLRPGLPALRGPGSRSTRSGSGRSPARRLRLILAKRAFLGLLAVAFLPFIVRVIQVYIVTRFPEAGRVLPVDGRLFGEFLNQQIGFTILLSIFGASGLIANDLRTGAILVYLSRPLTRRDYVLGKLCVPLALNLAVTLVPALVLYAVALALAPDQFLKWELAWIAPGDRRLLA